MASVQKITPSLWFDDNCEEAINFYVSVFPDSKIEMIQRYPEGVQEGPMKDMGGKVLTGIFQLAGQRFQALDGGPIFKFNEAISFSVECETQEEIDHYWENLSAVPESEQCGWCKDKFGMSWQIVPKQLGEFMTSDDPEKVGRVMEAFMQMKKFDIAKLQEAYDGK
ncbi:MAG TPA: VOC family protein [Candidatus Saccharimonadales bacterium]|nr:VOC family protein [Candidatus Saccharimonadales bacterium]